MGGLEVEGGGYKLLLRKKGLLMRNEARVMCNGFKL